MFIITLIKIYIFNKSISEVLIDEESESESESESSIYIY